MNPFFRAVWWVGERIVWPAGKEIATNKVKDFLKHPDRYFRSGPNHGGPHLKTELDIDSSEDELISGGRMVQRNPSNLSDPFVDATSFTANDFDGFRSMNCVPDQSCYFDSLEGMTSGDLLAHLEPSV